jgi:RND superfamily putative drug exporter
MKTMRDFMVASHSTMAVSRPTCRGRRGSKLMGQYFDEAKNDDSFTYHRKSSKPDFNAG